MRNNQLVKSTLGAALMLQLLTSCAETEPGQQQTDVADDKLSSVEVLLRDYYEFVHPETRSSSGAFKIKSISSKRHELTSETVSSLMTRSVETETDTLPYEIKTVELDFGDNEGYAILSDDPRINRVFYFTEEGCVADTAQIAPLKELLDSYPAVAEELMTAEPEALTRYDGTPIVGPIVRFKWGQSAPFNLQGIYCTCESCSRSNYGNHMPIGCVNVALGQTIATIGKFKGTFYGSKQLDFKTMPSYSYSMNQTQKVLVGRFLMEIAINCQTKFGCNGSGATAQAALNYLKDQGYVATYASGGLNISKTLELIKKGTPILMMGNNSDVGHMWIVDGIGVQNGGYDYHCNWGWGGSSDGWTIGNPYTLPDGHKSYPKNLAHINIEQY